MATSKTLEIRELPKRVNDLGGKRKHLFAVTKRRMRVLDSPISRKKKTAA